MESPKARPSRLAPSNTDGPPFAQTAVETADQIRELIASGAYGPGQRLPPERSLAKQIGVSRGAIREALSQLAALNIVRSRQGAGTFVSTLGTDHLFAPLDFAVRIDPKALLHLYELRRIFEPVGAGLAASRIDAAGLTGLAELRDEYERAHLVDDRERMIEVDELIHMAVATASVNPLLVAILTSLASAAHRSRLITAHLPTTPPASRAELHALIDAIVDRDPLRAEASMLRHLARLEADARTALAEGPSKK